MALRTVPWALAATPLMTALEPRDTTLDNILTDDPMRRRSNYYKKSNKIKLSGFFGEKRKSPTVDPVLLRVKIKNSFVV